MHSSLLVLLQATNPGVRRPGYEASSLLLTQSGSLPFAVVAIASQLLYMNRNY